MAAEPAEPRDATAQTRPREPEPEPGAREAGRPERPQGMVPGRARRRQNGTPTADPSLASRRPEAWFELDWRAVCPRARRGGAVGVHDARRVGAAHVV
jgi:hypothetical protein